MASIEDAYNEIGADYKDVLKRLSSEALVERFAKRFLEDESFSNLKAAMQEGADAEAAFLGAHTLKGICQNLGLTNLFEPANELTEALRDRTFEGSEGLFEPVEREYERTAAALKAALGL
jgi:histidine phosphotransfer protein HptB